jgi:hypothetical protein
MADHLHKLCHLVRHLNMEMTEVQLQTLHTNLVVVVEVLVPPVVQSLEVEPVVLVALE